MGFQKEGEKQNMDVVDFVGVVDVVVVVDPLIKGGIKQY